MFSTTLRGAATVACSLFLIFSTANGQTDHSKKRVAIFIHEGVEILDFTGPAEVFSKAKADSVNAYEVYTVAVSQEAITSNNFLKIIPNYSIDNCPKPDIIVFPGGNTGIPLQDDRVIQWIRNSAKDQTILMSVCTGAFLLAKAGLLDGKDATTHYCCQLGLATDFPKVRVLSGKRFIDNGNILTTEGISAGIDGSLYLLGRECGLDVAKKTARYMMYNWQPDGFKSDQAVVVKP